MRKLGMMGAAALAIAASAIGMGPTLEQRQPAPPPVRAKYIKKKSGKRKRVSAHAQKMKAAGRRAAADK